MEWHVIVRMNQKCIWVLIKNKNFLEQHIILAIHVQAPEKAPETQDILKLKYWFCSCKI